MESFQDNPGYTCRLEFLLSVWLVTNLTLETITFPPRYMMLISTFFCLLLFIGDTILLFRFKLGDEVLDLSGLGAVFIGHSADGGFIFYYSHELWVELQMVHLEIILWVWKYWRKKDLTWGLTLWCIYFRFCGGGRQASLTVETFLEVKASRGWGKRVYRKMVLSGGCNRTSCLWSLYYPMLSWLPLCVQWWR